VNPGKMSETHLQIAELYEQNSDFTNKWGEIAYHFLKGGNIRKAYEYAWEAANNCFSLLETQQIIGILEKIYPQMPDETDKFKITFKLGQLYENISKNDEAIEKYKQAEKSIPPEENRLKLYDRLGTLYRLKGKYDLSSHYLEKALESAEEALDKAYIFTKICTDYQRKGEMDEAQKYLEKTQSIIETAETELTDATQNSALLDIYKELAIFYQKKSDYANSLDYLQKALIIAKNLNKTQATVSIKNLIALVYQNLGKYEEALTNLEKTLNLSKQSGDLLNVGNCYNNISIIHQKLQDFEKSLKYSEQALETYRKIGLERMISSSLTNMANALLSLDRYDEALEYYQKCLKMPSVKKEKRVIAILKNNIGIIYKTQGYIKKSLKSFLQSYKIWEKVQNEYHILLTSLNIIELYSSFNQFEKAEKYLQNAREIVERKKLEIWNEQLYKILFEFHISKKEYEKAQENLDSYETIFDRDNPSEYGNFLIQKLFLALSTSDIIHAKEIASELQTLIKQHNLSYIAQKSYFPLAKMYLLTKNYRRAIHNFKKAENSTKSLRQKWRIQYYLSTAYEALGVYEEAKIKAENAKELFDSFMEKIGDETLRKSYLQYEPQKSFYDEYERIMKSDENMAATESVESRDSQYRFLLQLNRLISSQLNLGDLLDTIVDAAIDFTDAERGFLLLKNSNDNLECSVAKNKKGEDISSASYTMSSSIVSKVMENGEPELVSDTSRNEFTRNQASIIELNLKSIICVPLKSNIKMEDQENRAFGCIYVDSKSYQKHFDATDADFLNILANQAAISIQNSEMYEKIQRQQKKLKQQYEITKSLGKVLDIEELLIEIMDTVIASTGADRGFLMLYEEKSEALDFKLARNNREETLPEEEMRISFSIANAAIKNKEPIRITMDDSDVFAKAESIVTLNLTSILCAPMIVEGNLLGVVYVDTKKIDNMFDQEAENFLYTLCGGLGIIIHNAQLYTELKKAHKQLMKLDEMKSKFINITSHELRTPLTAIQGYVFYLKKDLTDDERYAKLLEILEQNMLRLSSTVNDVINISKLTSNEMKFKLSEIDIKETVEEVIHRNEPIFDKRNQAFHSEIQDNIGSIEGDKIHLQQAITNILNNAIKYTPDGGEISVSVFRDRKNLYIRIKDTGIGIPEDELNNIFMKFYEVQDISHHSSGTYQFKSGGLGLGLSIAKEIVEGHGGYIDVKSQVEKGSSFTIILPYRDKNKNEQKR
jgi:signal transduction histidine kinase/Tfp pilus assembly protein PilF